MAGGRDAADLPPTGAADRRQGGGHLKCQRAERVEATECHENEAAVPEEEGQKSQEPPTAAAQQASQAASQPHAPSRYQASLATLERTRTM